jgi:hypothetical protein
MKFLWFSSGPTRWSQIWGAYMVPTVVVQEAAVNISTFQSRKISERGKEFSLWNGAGHSQTYRLVICCGIPNIGIESQWWTNEKYWKLQAYLLFHPLVFSSRRHPDIFRVTSWWKSLWVKDMGLTYYLKKLFSTQRLISNLQAHV